MTNHTALRRFFEEYAKAGLGWDFARTASFYTDSFVAAAPGGSAAFTNDWRFLDWLKEVREFNQSTGMEALEVLDVAETPISDHHRLARVRWGARFRKTGAELLPFEITYVVQTSGARPKIIFSVSHQDQEAEMKARGLLPG